MKDKREYIIRKAMELYALEGYQNVSITLLQNALEIGRGSLYYYFKSQDELFQCCMTTYFLEPKQRALQSVNVDTVQVEDMIGAIKQYMDSLKSALMTFTNRNINTSNTNHLMFTAYNLFPNLHNHARRLALHEWELWRKAIINSQRAGKVRHGIDVEVIAMMFLHVKDSYDTGLGKGQMDFDKLISIYYELYKLIKIQENP